MDPAPDGKDHTLVKRIVMWALKILILAILLTVSALIYRAWTPQSLEEIGGYDEEQANPVVRNLPALLKQAQDANYPVVLSERDINLYLKQVLRARQDGPLGILARYDGVAVRLYDGYAEVVIIRVLGEGHKQTVSLYLSPSNQETYDGPAVVTDFYCPDLLFGLFPIGGRIGNVPVPQGYIALAKPAFSSLGDALEPEIELLLDAYRPIKIRKGELEIMPSRRNDLH